MNTDSVFSAIAMIDVPNGRLMRRSSAVSTLPTAVNTRVQQR